MLTKATFGPIADHGAFDGLAASELPRLDRRLEHRREIFFLIAHCVLPSDRPSGQNLR